MAQVSIWSGVGVSFQSAADADVTITAITQANPAVVTASGHGYSDGDYVLMKVQAGMVELNNRIFRVANSTANDFELEGLDSTAFSAFSTGASSKLTLGNNITTITSLSASGGDANFIDTTTIHDDIQKQIPGLSSALSYSFENLWDVNDAGLVAMKAASDNSAQSGILFQFKNGQIMVFYGYISASLLPVGSAQDKVTTTTTISANGVPTYYSS